MTASKKKSVKKTAPKKEAKHKSSALAIIKSNSSEKRANPPGRGGQVLPPTPKPFTKENQPDPELKKAGWARKKALKELIDIQMCGKMEGSTINYRKLTAQFYGIDESDVTVRMALEYRQIEKALKGGDTAAFNAVMDRALGKAKQAIELIPDMIIKINGKVVGSKPTQ